MKAAQGAIRLVDEIKIDQPKTKVVAEMLKKFEAEKMSILFLTDENNQNMVKSCRNIQRVSVMECLNASTLEILRARKLFITKSALTALTKGLADV